MALVSAVTENAFAKRRQSDWDELDALAYRVSKRGVKSLSINDVARVSPLYRDVCADLAQAKAARYSAPLVLYIEALTASAHGMFYGISPPARAAVASRIVAF